jgi:hypothetical protein
MKAGEELEQGQAQVLASGQATGRRRPRSSPSCALGWACAAQPIQPEVEIPIGFTFLATDSSDVQIIYIEHQRGALLE